MVKTRQGKENLSKGGAPPAAKAMVKGGSSRGSRQQPAGKKGGGSAPVVGRRCNTSAGRRENGADGGLMGGAAAASAAGALGCERAVQDLFEGLPMTLHLACKPANCHSVVTCQTIATEVVDLTVEDSQPPRISDPGSLLARYTLRGSRSRPVSQSMDLLGGSQQPLRGGEGGHTTAAITPHPAGGVTSRDRGRGGGNSMEERSTGSEQADLHLDPLHMSDRDLSRPSCSPMDIPPRSPLHQPLSRRGRRGSAHSQRRRGVHAEEDPLDSGGGCSGQDVPPAECGDPAGPSSGVIAIGGGALELESDLHQQCGVSASQSTRCLMFDRGGGGMPRGGRDEPAAAAMEAAGTSAMAAASGAGRVSIGRGVRRHRASIGRGGVRGGMDVDLVSQGMEGIVLLDGAVQPSSSDLDPKSGPASMSQQQLSGPLKSWWEDAGRRPHVERREEDQSPDTAPSGLDPDLDPTTAPECDLGFWEPPCDVYEVTGRRGGDAPFYAKCCSDTEDDTYELMTWL